MELMITACYSELCYTELCLADCLVMLDKSLPSCNNWAEAARCILWQDGLVLQGLDDDELLGGRGGDNVQLNGIRVCWRPPCCSRLAAAWQAK